MATLEEHRADLAARLGDGGLLAPYVRHQLAEQHDELAAFLRRHGPLVTRALPTEAEVRAATDRVVAETARTDPQSQSFRS